MIKSGDSLSNIFHIAVCLLSNRSQLTSKCGENKKSGTRGAAYILRSFVIYYDPITVETCGNMQSVSHNKRANI